MNDRRAAERSVEAVVQEREPHVYRPGRKARAMNDGRVIRQALGDAGRTGVRRALEQGYELSEVARATVRLDDGEVFGYYPATFRVDDPSDLERSLFSSVGRFQRSWPPIRRMPLFNRRERSVVISSCWKACRLRRAAQIAGFCGARCMRGHSTRSGLFWQPRAAGTTRL